MAIAIRPFTREWIPAVVAFNDRLAAGGVPPEFRFPESDVPDWLPHVDGRRIYQQFYLAVEGSDVRGAYILKYQDFSFGGDLRRVVHYRLPISEGIVNKAYSRVGVHMLRSAMKAEPVLFCLGMGGLDRPLPQMLKAVGWHLLEIPFYFRVQHVSRFLREIVPLRRTAGQRFVADVAASTGAGWAGISALQRVRRTAVDRSVTTEIVSDFGSWADDIWTRTHSCYPLIGCRDRTTLNLLYLEEKPFIRLRISRGGEVIGWAVLLDTQMRANKYFGNLRLGSIVDCLAAPNDARGVMRAAADCLADRGVDLIICNQAHGAWTVALRTAGFLAGPSNFIFGTSKPLQAGLSPLEPALGRPYIMRGDGDGPVNL